MDKVQKGLEGRVGPRERSTQRAARRKVAEWIALRCSRDVSLVEWPCAEEDGQFHPKKDRIDQMRKLGDHLAG